MSRAVILTEDDMMERLLAVLLAGALVAPRAGLASEGPFKDRGPKQASSGFEEKLPLPPIPYLDTMRWMNFASSQSKGPRVDTLLLPDFDVWAVPKNPAFASYNSPHAELLSSRTASK
jgi:hypothetical protein